MNNGHLSASERKIRALEQHISELELMRQEYFLLLNHLIKKAGGVAYTFTSADAKACYPPRPVRCERRNATDAEVLAGTPIGALMEFTLVEPEEKPRIIVPS